MVIELNSTSQPKQPKARFYTRLNERDYLGVTVWPGKTDPAAEVIVVQLRRRDGNNWETVGRLAVIGPQTEHTRNFLNASDFRLHALNS